MEWLLYRTDPSQIGCLQVRPGDGRQKPEDHESAIYEADSPSFENQLIVILPQVQSTMNYRGRIDDLLEYLGDWVTVDLIKEDVIKGYEDCKSTTFRFISKLKTSEEWLSLCMDVYNHGFDGLHYFNP